MLKATDCLIFKTLRCGEDGKPRYTVVAKVGEVSYLKRERALLDDALVIKFDLRHGGEFCEGDYAKLSDKYSA